MEKKDWMQTVANVDAAESIWYENINNAMMLLFTLYTTLKDTLMIHSSVTVFEGKYHQVKRMLAARGKPVCRLCRLSVGGLELDNSLEPGAVRALTEEDLCTVFIGRK